MHTHHPSLLQGDITALAVDAIVNAAKARLLGLEVWIEPSTPPQAMSNLHVNQKLPSLTQA